MITEIHWTGLVLAMTAGVLLTAAAAYALTVFRRHGRRADMLERPGTELRHHAAVR